MLSIRWHSTGSGSRVAWDVTGQSVSAGARAGAALSSERGSPEQRAGQQGQGGVLSHDVWASAAGGQVGRGLGGVYKGPSGG